MEKIDAKIKKRATALANLEKSDHPGRPFGSKNKKTIAIEQAWKGAEQVILDDILATIRAQKYIAQGISVMMVPTYKEDKEGKIERTGKFRQETDVKKVVARLEDPNEIDQKDYYFIFTKDPNPKALEDVISRVFGRSRDKGSEIQDPFERAFRNLFLTFTQNNPTVLVNESNNAPDPEKQSESSPPQQLKPAELIGENDRGATSILERIERAVSEPTVEAESSVLD